MKIDSEEVRTDESSHEEDESSKTNNLKNEKGSTLPK
jgi:hypothetical protein